MEKCLSCHIVLDCLCPKPLCPGHYNESQGDLCAYCATHQRDAWLQHPDWLDGVVSTLGAFLEYAQEAIAYPWAADKYLRPLASRLSSVNQLVIRTRNAFSTPRPTQLACL